MPKYRKYPIFIQNQDEDWYPDMLTFIESRFDAILDRFVHTYRFLDFDPMNARAFSYEYASLLRDAGSCFSSVLDHILSNSDVKPLNNRFYTIKDFSLYLLDIIEDIQEVGVVLNYDSSQKYVYPFRNLGEEKVSDPWWIAYNELKHNELNAKSKGCLSNLVYTLAALAIIYDAVTKGNAVEGFTSAFSIITRGLIIAVNTGTVPDDEFHFPVKS